MFAGAGITGSEPPAELDGRPELMEFLEAIRCAAGVAMGLGEHPDAIRQRSPSNPKIGLVAEPLEALDPGGWATPAAAGDLTARMVSMGNTHRALPLTGALCLGVAAHITGTVVNRHARNRRQNGTELRILQPSGVTVVGAQVDEVDGGWHARVASVYRTQRRLFEGSVLIPASRYPSMAS